MKGSMNIKHRKIIEKYHIVENEIKLKFPNEEYSIAIDIWNDGDFQIMGRHGSGDGITHVLRYHHSEDTLVWCEDSCKTYAMKVDQYGHRYCLLQN